MSNQDTATSSPSGGLLVALLGRLIPPGIVISIIRTWVPIAIGGGIAWVAAEFHVVLSSHQSSTAALTATSLVIAAYYALGRLIEAKWPRVGRWLIALNLVVADPPSYVPVAPAPTPTPTPAPVTPAPEPVTPTPTPDPAALTPADPDF